MIAHGYLNTEIASRLDISAQALEATRQRAMQKLRLGSRSEIVRYA
jgi:DNA-binding NarL/FixJ family response regulator